MDAGQSSIKKNRTCHMHIVKETLGTHTSSAPNIVLLRIDPQLPGFFFSLLCSFELRFFFLNYSAYTYIYHLMRLLSSKYKRSFLSFYIYIFFRFVSRFLWSGSLWPPPISSFGLLLKSIHTPPLSSFLYISEARSNGLFSQVGPPRREIRLLWTLNASWAFDLSQLCQFWNDEMNGRV